MHQRLTRQQQFERACQRLEAAIESGPPYHFLLHRVAIGTVFMMQGLDKERAQGILKKVFLLHQEQEERRASTNVEYIRRSENP